MKRVLFALISCVGVAGCVSAQAPRPILAKELRLNTDGSGSPTTLTEAQLVTLLALGTGGMPDGTVSLPGLPFASDLDTGIWRPASNVLAISTGGAEVLRLSSAGAKVSETDDSALTLAVSAGGGKTGALTASNSAGFLTLETDLPAIRFRKSGTTYATVDTAGVTAPGVKMSAAGSQSAPVIYSSAATTSGQWFSSGIPAWSVNAKEVLRLRTDGITVQASSDVNDYGVIVLKGVMGGAFQFEATSTADVDDISLDVSSGDPVLLVGSEGGNAIAVQLATGHPAWIPGASPVVFDGATQEATNKTTITVTDPTAPRSIAIPNASGTFAVAATSPLVLSSAGGLTINTALLGDTTIGTAATNFLALQSTGTDADVQSPFLAWKSFKSLGTNHITAKAYLTTGGVLTFADGAGGGGTFSQVAAPRFLSSVATGTAPLVVASTTNVANLNASSLSGATFAAPGGIGSGTAGTALFSTVGVSDILTLAAGNAGTPPLTTTGDTNTGVYFPAADTVGITAGGSQVGKFTTTGMNATVIGATTQAAASVTSLYATTLLRTDGAITAGGSTGGGSTMDVTGVALIFEGTADAFDTRLVATDTTTPSKTITLPNASGTVAVAVTAPVTLSAGGTIAVPNMIASGASHAAGLVPDPGASAGTTKFLREDGTFQVPAGGSTPTLDDVTGAGNSTSHSITTGSASVGNLIASGAISNADADGQITSGDGEADGSNPALNVGDSSLGWYRSTGGGYDWSMGLSIDGNAAAIIDGSETRFKGAGVFGTLTPSGPTSGNLLLERTAEGGYVTLNFYQAFDVRGGYLRLTPIDNTFEMSRSLDVDGVFTANSIISQNTLVSTSPSGGIGYATGAGGTVTQATNKSTGVTLDKVCGQITMNGAAMLTGTVVSFTVTNSTVAATDVIPPPSIASEATAGAYTVTVDAVAAGSFRISVRNLSVGTLSEALVLNFAVIKGVSS